jgi:HNH endonuclease
MIGSEFWEGVVELDSGCWHHWRKPRSDGYTPILVDGKYIYAHRIAYMLAIGPIQDGMQLDHLCRNPRCVNPSHLEPVTQRENLLRGDTIVARNVKKDRCLRGHEFTEENTYMQKNTRGGHQRQCRECHRLREQERRKRAKEVMPR